MASAMPILADEPAISVATGLARVVRKGMASAAATSAPVASTAAGTKEEASMAVTSVVAVSMAVASAAVASTVAAVASTVAAADAVNSSEHPLQACVFLHAGHFIN